VVDEDRVATQFRVLGRRGREDLHRLTSVRRCCT
jgi:hypothetical protein